MDLNREILIETQINDSEWFKFIQKCPQKEIFQTPYMRTVFDKTKAYTPFCFFARDENGELIASLLAYTIRDNVPFSFFSRRAIVEGGPLFLQTEKGRLAAKILLERFRREMKKKAIFAEIRNHRSTQDLNPIFRKGKFDFIDHLNILVDLTQGEDKLWKTIKKTRRSGIKRAIKSGVLCKEIENESEMKELYQILKRTYKRVKIPLADESLFLEIFRELVPKNLSRPSLIKLDENIIGGRVPLLYEGKIFAWYGGSLSEYYKYHPNDLSVWELLKWGIANNYTIFDFGGAGHPNEKYGVRDFKMQFGGKMVNYGRYQHLIRPNYYKISKIGFKLWRIVDYFSGRFFV